MVFSGSSRKSFLERRLKELKKESAVVADDVRTLSKAVRNPEQLENLPRLKYGGLSAVPAPRRKDPAQGAAPEPSSPRPPAARGELFDWAHAGSRQASPARAAAEPAQEGDSQSSRSTVSSDERFAQYFSSTSFLGGKPLRQEKNVQRNKAVFMLMVIVALVFIVIKLVSN